MPPNPTSNPAPPALWLVDNSLRNRAGHPLEYARVVAKEALRRNMVPHVLAHCSVNGQALADDIGLEAAFRPMFFDRFNSSGPLLRLGRIGLAADYVRANDDFYRDLHACLAPRVHAGDIVFAPSVDHRQLMGWSRFVRALPRARFPRALVLMMRYNFRDGLDHRLNPHRKMVARGLAAMQGLVRAGFPVRMATDSERLAAEYQEYAPGLKFEVLPIPHTQRAMSLASVARERTVGAPVRFVALGDARVEKGYDLLAAAIRVLATFGGPGNAGLSGMEFALQCPVTHAMNESGLAELDALRALALPNISLIDQVLSSDQYVDLLASADVVALPYRKQQYDARSSGPLAEALAAAKPVIVTQETWLSDQLARHGAGYAVRDGDVVGLAKALQDARDHIDALRVQAAARQPEWAAFHNPATLIDLLAG